MKNYTQKGEILELTAPGGGVVSGGGYVIGGFFVVAVHDANAGEKFSAQVVGVFSLPKAAGNAFVEGEYVYWDDTAKAIKPTSTGYYGIGCVIAAYASADTEAEVRLDGTHVTAVA